MKKKRKINKSTFIILGIVIFCLVVPQITLANPIYDLIFGGAGTIFAMEVGKGILTAITTFVFFLLSLIVRLAGTMFNIMIEVGFSGHLDIVKAGWNVIRDFTNMIFILFLVIIAFATILRNEKYGVKKLLPKLIIIALLINFSMVLSSAVIDFSNLTASFFIKEVRQSASGKGGVSGSIIDSLNLLKTQELVDCTELSDNDDLKKCKEEMANRATSDAMTFFVSITMGSLVLIVTAFVLFAGAILLLIRIVYIWFLVMLVPLALIAIILPGLNKMWQKWLKSFLTWCFFAPAYAFFIWIAVKVASEGKVEHITSGVNSSFIGGTGSSLLNAFISSPTIIIHFLFIIALLLGGLIASKQFGVAGADTIIKTGQKAYKGVGRWAMNRTRERISKPAEATSQALGDLYGKTLGRVPIIKSLGLGKITQVPARIMARQTKEIDEEKKKIGSLYSPDTIKSLWQTFTRTQKIAAGQVLAEKGKFEKGGSIKEKDLGRIVKLASIYGDHIVKPMLINRPDLAVAIKKAGQSDRDAIIDVLKKISPEKASNIQFEAVNSPVFGDIILEEMLDNFRPSHFANIANKNIRLMNKIMDAKLKNPSFGTTTNDRKANLETRNKALADYISGVMGQSAGWHFG